MKKAMLSLAAIASAAVLTPAVANAAKDNVWSGVSYGGYSGTQLNQREQRIEWQIRRGERNGTINRAESVRLRNELRQFNRIEARYSRGGFTRGELIDLSRMLNRIEGRVDLAMGTTGPGVRYGMR